MSNKEKKKDIDDPKLYNVKLFTNCMIDASSKQKPRTTSNTTSLTFLLANKIKF